MSVRSLTSEELGEWIDKSDLVAAEAILMLWKKRRIRASSRYSGSKKPFNPQEFLCSIARSYEQFGSLTEAQLYGKGGKTMYEMRGRKSGAKGVLKIGFLGELYDLEKWLKERGYNETPGSTTPLTATAKVNKKVNKPLVGQPGGTEARREAVEEKLLGGRCRHCKRGPKQGVPLVPGYAFCSDCLDALRAAEAKAQRDLACQVQDPEFAKVLRDQAQKKGVKTKKPVLTDDEVDDLEEKRKPHTVGDIRKRFRRI